MNETQPKNPLHGVTLEKLLNELVAFHGWDALGRKVDIRCFNHDPSIASSLKFLRRTPWARERVEALYIDLLRRGAKQRRNAAEP
ncbi:MAG: VF530 family protein [Gallionellaceae bacterium]|nr:VF530 family protein [Gallionellaceae bacterium]